MVLFPTSSVNDKNISPKWIIDNTSSDNKFNLMFLVYRMTRKSSLPNMKWTVCWILSKNNNNNFQNYLTNFLSTLPFQSPSHGWVNLFVSHSTVSLECQLYTFGFCSCKSHLNLQKRFKSNFGDWYSGGGEGMAFNYFSRPLTVCHVFKMNLKGNKWLIHDWFLKNLIDLLIGKNSAQCFILLYIQPLYSTYSLSLGIFNLRGNILNMLNI